MCRARVSISVPLASQTLQYCFSSELLNKLCVFLYLKQVSNQNVLKYYTCTALICWCIYHANPTSNSMIVQYGQRSILSNSKSQTFEPHLDQIMWICHHANMSVYCRPHFISLLQSKIGVYRGIHYFCSKT